MPKPSSAAQTRRGRLRSVVTARPWLTALVAAVVVGAGVATVLFAGGSDASTASTGVTTRLVSVTTGSVRAAVSTTGTFSPADEHDVSFDSSAEITSVRVSEGEPVSKGQILATIAPTSLRAALAQVRVTLAQAEAALASAEDDSSTTSAELAADRAGVTSARASVTSARTALAGATLRSPISGTVAEVNVAVGDQSGGSSASSGASNGASRGGSATAASTATSSSSSGDFVVVGMKKWTVAATVDDTQVGLIKKGDQVQLTTDNVSGTVFGTVSSVSVLSSDSSGSASYPVQIAVTGSPSGLHDGASATASIIYKQVSNVLTVPTTAVHRDTSGTYVELAVNGAQQRTTVKTGLSSGGTTQITSGLKSGQQVYVQVVTPTGTGTGNSQQRSGTFPGSGEFPAGGRFQGGYFGGGNRSGGGYAPGGGFGGSGQ